MNGLYKPLPSSLNRKSALLKLRISPDLDRRIDVYAAHHVTRSEAIRILLREALERKEAGGGGG